MSSYEPIPPSSSPYDPAPVAASSPVLSILSLVFGVIGVLGSFFFGIGFLPAIAALILGIVGRRKEINGRGMALAGIILGIVGILIAIGWVVLIAIGAAAGMANGTMSN